METNNVLAPLRHTPASVARTDTICDRVEALHARARGIEAAPAPKLSGGHEAGWLQTVQDMIAKIDELAAACSGSDYPKAEQPFLAVYGAFHGITARPGHRH